MAEPELSTLSRKLASAVEMIRNVLGSPSTTEPPPTAKANTLSDVGLELRAARERIRLVLLGETETRSTPGEPDAASSAETNSDRSTAVSLCHPPMVLPISPLPSAKSCRFRQLVESRMPPPVSCRCDRPTPFPVASCWYRNRPRRGGLLESWMPPPVVSCRSELPPKGPKLPPTGVWCNVDESGSQNCRPRPFQSAGGLVKHCKPPQRWTMLPYVVVSSMPFQPLGF